MTTLIEFPRVVDATMIATLRSCPQKMMRMYLQHWKPKGESIHLHAGGAFARGLEAARRSYFEAEFPADVALAHGMRALVGAYGSFVPPEGSNKTLERMMGALDYYFEIWPLESDPCRPHRFPSGKRGIEFSFAVPLPYLHPVTHEPIIYAGRSDMVADFAGGLYIEDDKTASQLGASWSKQWDLRSQFTGYCWAAAESGLDVNGIIVRGVSILKTKYDSMDAITYRPKWQVERWLGQVVRDLARLEACWQDNYYDFALDHACDEYGGCPFKQICISAEPDAWLPMYFDQRVWNPLDRTEVPLVAASQGLEGSGLEGSQLEELR
jgi:PD-(D/E)XK nuclease superfamily